MTNVETTEEEEKMAQKPMLRLVSGGKGPPDNGGNWLIKLEKNCVFSCKENGKEVDLEVLRLVFKHEKTVIIADALNSQPARAVNPEGFCKRHKLFEILEEGGDTPPKEGGERPPVKETDDGSRTIRSSGVGNDEDAPRGQPEHG